jgi:hypothetical protein
MYHLRSPRFWALFVGIGLFATYILEIVAAGMMPDYLTNSYLPSVVEFLTFFFSSCIAYLVAKSCVPSPKHLGFPIVPPTARMSVKQDEREVKKRETGT